MTPILLLLLFSSRVIELKEVITSANPYDSRVQEDGSIIITTNKELFHFDRTGALILHLKDTGYGPAALEKVGSAVFSGGLYYILDPTNFNIGIFDRKGQFLNKQITTGTQLQVTAGELYITDRRALIPERTEFNALARITLEEKNQLKTHKPFFPVSELTEKLSFHYTRHYIAKFNGDYFVMETISNDLAKLSPALAPVARVKVNLPEYVPPKCCYPEKGFEEIKKYVSSQSYILLMAQIGTQLAIAYTVPSAKDIPVLDLRVQCVDGAGKPTMPVLVNQGFFIGGFKDELYFLETTLGPKSRVMVWSKK